MTFTVRFHSKFTPILRSTLLHPTKVLWMSFEISFKLHLTHCACYNMEFQILKTQNQAPKITIFCMLFSEYHQRDRWVRTFSELPVTTELLDENTILGFWSIISSWWVWCLFWWCGLWPPMLYFCSVGLISCELNFPPSPRTRLRACKLRSVHLLFGWLEIVT